MKHFTVVLLLMLSLSLQAQIVKEHTFKDKFIWWALDTNETVYWVRRDGPVAHFYNDHFQLSDSLVPNPPAGYTFDHCQLAYRRVFDNDPGIEWVGQYSKDSSGTRVFMSVLHDDDGSTILTFPKRTGAVIRATSNGTKLQMRNSLDGSYDIYGVPGNYVPTPTEAPVDPSKMQLYPNPANGHISVEFQLPEGTRSSTLTIYNLLGEEVDQIQVGDAFNTVQVDVSLYAKGSYMASLNGQVVKKFVVE